MTLAQETEINIKKYGYINDDDPSVIQVSTVPHSEVFAVQGQSSLHGNNPYSNQIQYMNTPRLNWKANLTCYKCGEKWHLA